MVKADLTRDYYDDLGVLPTADLAEIKKQFKKLALTYHPDRNPGRESEVTAKFQKIQSAHEVLIDVHERAKYDANRVRPTARYQSGGNQRGNPWSNVGSQFPPPPKPPTARNRAPPPPSAGAQRYKNFETPRQSANQSAQEGAEARRSTYQAWENMRNSTAKNGPGHTWNKPSAVPKGTSQSAREESNANSYKNQRRAPPSTTGPDFDEYRNPPSPHRRAQSSSAQNRKGFMPNTPGGDEPAAPRGAYFTERNKSAQAPEPPPRQTPVYEEIPSSRFHPNPPPRTSATTQGFDPHSSTVDPLRQFRQAEVPYEPRLSTPYATHGGEKLNPFDSSNMNRSKSTRESRDRHGRPSDSQHIPRAGSDSNLGSPKGAQSFSQSSRQGRHAYAVPLDSDSGSDDGPTIKTRPRPGQSYQDRTFAKPRSSVRSPPQGNGAFSPKPAQSSSASETNGQNSQRSWNDTATATATANAPPTKEPPSMYGTSSFTKPVDLSQDDPFRPSGYRKPTVSEPPKARKLSPSWVQERFSRPSIFQKYPYLFPPKERSNWKSNSDAHPTSNLFTSGKLSNPPSGAPSPNLYPLEETQRSVLDNLIHHRFGGTPSTPARERPSAPRSFTVPSLSSNPVPVSQPMAYRDSSEVPAKKQRHTNSEVRPEPQDPFVADATPKFSNHMKENKPPNANGFLFTRFNINVDNNAFKPTHTGSFSSSAENINTKFTPEEWDGKFEAGYFQPEQKAAGVSHTTRTRTQSGGRSRGRSRSPTKYHKDPLFSHPAHSDSEVPMSQSPGGTKFSQEEWAGTFKPQTFMPPPPPPASKTPGRPPTRKRSSVIKPTMGNAAVIDSDSDSTPEKPLFKGRKPVANPTPSPDPMDVDSPPVFQPTTPTARGPVPIPTNLNSSPPKRPAASSSPIDPDATAQALKVNFADLQIRDLISSMALPSPPSAPSTLPHQHTRADYDTYLTTFAAYMRDWDLFSNRIMLHLVARKNQNDRLVEKRWMDDQGLNVYRLGLREDGVVLKHFADAEEGHGKVLRDHAVVRERIREIDGGEGKEERPRKKVS